MPSKKKKWKIRDIVPKGGWGGSRDAGPCPYPYFDNLIALNSGFFDVKLVKTILFCFLGSPQAAALGSRVHKMN